MAFTFHKCYLMGVFPIIGFFIGDYLDRKETERMVMFRDKSALYGRPEDPNRPPSWP